jgi:DNA-binding transcriptional MerR regulator
MTQISRFPIRTLADKTHVGASTLRAWERRYGLLKPERTPKGHRLYNQADIRRVNRIVELLHDGHALGTIKDMLLDESPIQHDAVSGSTEARQDIWSRFIEKTLTAAEDLNIERIDTIFNEASSLYPVDMVIDKLIEPVLESIGLLWQENPQSGIAIEHFYSSWLRSRIFARFHHGYHQARGCKVVFACAPGCNHEVGLMLLALSALSRGYRVLYFGTDLPLEQLRYIQQRSAANAIVLSIHQATDAALNQALEEFLTERPVPVFIGGRSEVVALQDLEDQGAVLIGDKVAVAIKVLESHLPVYTVVGN